jgi:hypothetical protein
VRVCSPVHERRSSSRELFERVVAEDGDDAEPGVKMLAEEGRNVLPRMDDVRRVLVVATDPPAGG